MITPLICFSLAGSLGLFATFAAPTTALRTLGFITLFISVIGFWMTAL